LTAYVARTHIAHRLCMTNAIHQCLVSLEQGSTRLRAARSTYRSLADLAPHEVKSVVDQYTGIHDAGRESRRQHYRSFVTHFYDLVTDFYEFGWGQSFHFAPRHRGESFEASLLRHQRFLADRLGLTPGMRVLDVGCGVGGPMGALARDTGASFVGLNNNAYQLERAKTHTRDVQSLCSFILGDYMQIPEGDESYDAVIAIESMPHAPDKTAAFREIFRVLRPGGFLGDTIGALPKPSMRKTRSTCG